MSWELNSNEPIYLQIMNEIELQIVVGWYKPGEQLPGVRALAQEAGVNPNTMQKALQELERKELVYAQRTSGRYVTENMEMIEKVKLRLADKCITDFLEGMKRLGLSNEDAIALLKRKAGEE